jgi:hypothetical protein
MDFWSGAFKGDCLDSDAFYRLGGDYSGILFDPHSFEEILFLLNSEFCYFLALYSANSLRYRYKAIYMDGIATGNATFQTCAPDWESWDKNHLSICRLVIESNQAVGWGVCLACL